MTDLAALATGYIAVWNENDGPRRRALIDELFDPACRLTDPRVAVEGTAAIDATIGQARAQFPGYSIRLAGPVDAHHDQARFTWEIVDADGNEPVVVGFDVVVVGEDGKLRQVLGFLDRVPAM